MPPQSIIKPITFAVVSRAGAAVCFVLAFVWLAMPEVLLGLWQVEAGTAALVVARRNAGVFAGVSVMLWLIRDAEASPARHAVSVGMLTLCTGLAVLGTYEYGVGHSGAGIVLAVAVEIALGAAFALAR